MPACSHAGNSSARLDGNGLQGRAPVGRAASRTRTSQSRDSSNGSRSLSAAPARRWADPGSLCGRRREPDRPAPANVT